MWDSSCLVSSMTFSCLYCQKTRKQRSAKSMSAAITTQAILYMNLKNPGKHTTATAAHTGEMPLEYR